MLEVHYHSSKTLKLKIVKVKVNEKLLLVEEYIDMVQITALTMEDLGNS